MTTKTIFLAVFSLLFLSACSNLDNETATQPMGDFTNGILVLNEGNTNKGTLTFINSDYSETIQDAYTLVNPDDDLGGFVQSIFFNNDLAYIISNFSNMITIVNRYTLEFVDRIDMGLNVPRYGVVLNGKAYVTNQADFSSTADDYVAVINLTTNTVEDHIILGRVAEKIYTYNNSIFVQNSSYGAGAEISKLNLSAAAVESTLSFSSSISDTAYDNGKLYVLDQAEITQVDMTTFLASSSWSLAETHVGASKLSVEVDEVYFTNANSVYRFNTAEDLISETPLFSYQSNSAFGTFYGFTVHQGLIYLSDAGDFASNGFIQIRTSEGDLVVQKEVGLGPNSFYFN